VLQGLDRFEGRSSLKTWLFTILTNKAKTRSQRENRTFTSTDLEETESNSPTVDPGRFNDPNTGKWPDHWADPPVSWAGIPEETLLSQETLQLTRQAIDALPEVQRIVITLRDMHELFSEEVCNVLGVSETNQRVLLHRARAKVRQALEDYLQPET
jgi:RNA polymerase sigma-70 factor (ECF subfamily)